VPKLTTATRQGPQVAIVVEPGVSVFEFSAVWDILSDDPGAGGVPWYRVSICSSTPPPIAMSVPGTALMEVRSLKALRSADIVVVPPIAEPSESTLAALRAAHARGARMVSLCTGAFVLAAAGLLDGRTATTHWAHAALLSERYPRVKVDERVLYIDDGDILTSAGSAACIDLCLHLVRKDFGAEVANSVARQMVVPPHRAGGQAQFVSTAIREVAEHDPFSDTLQWAQSNLAEPLAVEMLAHRAAMSPRTFARRFTDTTGVTPHQWLLRQRVMLAQRLLETTDLPVDRVAEECGLGTATNLRSHFRATIGTTPTAYRRTFRSEAG
jgi:AraC family transcriptional regulator, transcriptional activator FtrA